MDKGPSPHLDDLRVSPGILIADTDPATLLYEFTVDDRSTCTRPWLVRVPMIKSPCLIVENACHEGNDGLAFVLTAAQAEEWKAVERK